MAGSLDSRKLSTKTLVTVLVIIAVIIMSSAIYISFLNRTPSPTSPSTPSTTRIYIVMGGATFINPQMQAWIKKYMEFVDTSVTIEYQSIGSGAGEAKFIDRALDVGVSDVGISKTGYEKLVSSGRKFIQIPLVAGAVAIIYNIPEWSEEICGPLRLTGEVLVDIYLGKIIYWDDDSIKSLQLERCRDYCLGRRS